MRCDRVAQRCVERLVDTTVGRVLFNDMLPDGMDFYNRAMRSGDLAGAISDCYQRLGRKATINLLDDMMQMGFRESTRDLLRRTVGRTIVDHDGGELGM